jgi:ATP-binding cassette subfamily F protein 3
VFRDYLGGFDIRGDQVTQEVASFSGGEKARLALALIVWQRPNLLLLDEPTNHLDIEMREALAQALVDFEGGLVVVAHDRALLSAATDQWMLVADGRVQPFDGDLDDYKEWLLKTKLNPSQPAPKLPEPKKAEPVLPAADRREQKRAEAEQRQKASAARKPLESRIKRLEEQMAKLNAKKAAIDARLADPSIYDEANKEALKTLLADQAYVGRELAQIEAEWLEKQQELEQLA